MMHKRIMVKIGGSQKTLIKQKVQIEFINFAKVGGKFIFF